MGLLLPSIAKAEGPNQYMLDQLRYINRGYGEPLVPADLGLDRTSVGYETIRQATTTNAQIYGATGAFERYLRPVFDQLRKSDDDGSRQEDVYIFALDHHQTYGVGRAIGLCGQLSAAQDGYCDGRPRAYSADLYSTSISAGWGNPQRGFFLSASHSLTIIPPAGGSSEQMFQRGLYSFYLSLLTVGGMPAYRLLGKSVFNFLMPGSADGIVGGYTTLGPIKAYGGYVLSAGLFGDVALPDYGPFISTALSDSFSQIPLIKGGLRQLDLSDWLGLPDASGLTSLFAQRFELPTPTSATSDAQALASDQLTSLKDASVKVLTTHLQQMDIARHVDVKVAAGVLPTAFLHEAVVSIHTDGFSQRPTVSNSRDEREDSFAGALSLGTMALPNLSYYGVTGGHRLLFKAQVRYNFFSAYVRMNDTEFLQSFPFAYNAVNGGIAFTLREKDN